MLEPPKSAPDYAEQEGRRQKEISEGKGVTSWGNTHGAVDILKSPLVAGDKAASAGGDKKDDKDKK